MRTVKTLIRLGGCPGWSESLLGAQSLCWFCHVAAQIHKSYLSNRTQQVVINDWISVNGDVLCGVPQGSILGPLLFLLFINDLPLSLNDSPISVDLYADDTTLYSSASDKTSLETNLQNVLDLVHIWCLENGMLINIEKTKLMLIAKSTKKTYLNRWEPKTWV